MQLKGLIRLFTIALILISLFQLSFTFVVKNFEKKQASKIESSVKSENPSLNDKSDAFKLLVNDKLRFQLDSLNDKKIYNLGFTDYTYQEAKEQELNLGLDLQGGMNVVLEVSLNELVRNLSNNPKDPALNAAIAQAEKMKASSQDDFITLFADAYKAQNPNGQLAPLFAKPNSKELTISSSNDAVIKKLKNDAKAAIQSTYKVLGKRIDKFGVTQPNLSLDENRGIISVELAGVNNPERVRKYLQATAKLEFWRTYAYQEIVPNIIEADKNLKDYLSGKKVDDTTATSITDTNKVAKVGSDTSSLASLMNDKSTTSATDTNTKNLTDDQKLANARKENPLIFFLQYGASFKGQDEKGKQFHEARVSIIKNSDIPTLQGYLDLPAVKKAFPSDLKFLFGPLGNEEGAKNFSVVYAIRTERGKITPPLDGDVIEEAKADFSPLGEAEVSMAMDMNGANIWKRLTKDNIGKSIAIVLDDVVYSAPMINGEIPNGRSSISGSFTAETSKDLANVLETGKLPAPARIVQEQVVGPTLGQEAVNGGLMSFIIAFIVIFGLMLVYYNTAGWVANIALILNLLFTIGVLAALHASLTAAGIAGLVLTIGMAVDTNVIIFERIKEELKLGKSHEDAVNEGYRRSLSPVLDGHITVLMTAVILFIFGLGPVLGFATTQIIGILLSLFCGILVSRLITDMRMKKGKHFNYFTPFSEKLFQKFNFHFIEWRKKAYMISLVVALLGIGSIFNGFHLGVEFLGGRSYTVELNGKYKTSDVREKLQSVFEGDNPVVKTIGTGNTVNIVTAYKRSQNSDAVTNEIVEKLYNGLKAGNFIAANTTLAQFSAPDRLSSNTVSATISDDLKWGALKATLWSLVLIAVYIFIRFRKWQYSVGTLVALIHDVFIMLAIFSFLKNVVPFSLEIDQHFIAAILTVIGFSMNDTVIVFDRVREYFRKRPGESKTAIINAAINDTMSRTIMTSFTVFVTLLILFIFGGEVTKGFAFAMMIGVITGTYSSIFVAAPILVDLDKSNKLTQEVDKDQKIAELKEMA